MNPIVSVVLATRNRASKLERLFDSLAALETGPTWSWEAVVVDNGSTDNTPDVLAVAGRRLTLTALTRARPGKAAALNVALSRSRGSILAFTDDDCVVPPNWLSQIVAAFEGDPSLGGLGGRVELYDPADLPTATRTGREPWDLRSPEQLYDFAIGCNMAFRREVIQRLKGFDPRLGPGSLLPSDDDIDLIYRALRAGYRIRYLPQVLIYHGHGRKTVGDAESLARHYLRGRGALYCKFGLRGDWRVVRMAAREACDAVREALSPPPPPPPGEFRVTPAFRLRYLTEGAALRIRSLFRPSERPTE